MFLTQKISIFLFVMIYYKADSRNFTQLYYMVVHVLSEYVHPALKTDFHLVALKKPIFNQA